MASRYNRIIPLALVVTAVALAGCNTTPRRIVKESLEGIEKGVKGLDNVSGNIVSSLFTDRNRYDLAREHKETLSHLKKVKKFIKDRGIVTERADDKLLLDAKDRLASVGRQLETNRIPSAVGLRMYRQLDDVRQSLDLIRQRHNTPRYTGFTANR